MKKLILLAMIAFSVAADPPSIKGGVSVYKDSEFQDTTAYLSQGKESNELLLRYRSYLDTGITLIVNKNDLVKYIKTYRKWLNIAKNKSLKRYKKEMAETPIHTRCVFVDRYDVTYSPVTYMGYFKYYKYKILDKYHYNNGISFRVTAKEKPMFNSHSVELSHEFIVKIVKYLPKLEEATNNYKEKKKNLDKDFQ